MSVRDDFTPGEVLAAADLNDTFASKLPYSYGTATPTTTDSGFLWYDSNSTPAAPKFWDGSAFQTLTSGKILQIVRATDTTLRSTTSTSYVDITGVSITITPTYADSAILILLNAVSQVTKAPAGLVQTSVQITDSSNNSLTGTQSGYQLSANDNDNLGSVITLYGYSTPATTSATTYKGRFRSFSAGETSFIRGDLHITQMYALEISA